MTVVKRRRCWSSSCITYYVFISDLTPITPLPEDICTFYNLLLLAKCFTCFAKERNTHIHRYTSFLLHLSYIPQNKSMQRFTCSLQMSFYYSQWQFLVKIALAFNLLSGFMYFKSSIKGRSFYSKSNKKTTLSHLGVVHK